MNQEAVAQGKEPEQDWSKMLRTVGFGLLCSGALILLAEVWIVVYVLVRRWE